MHLARQGLGDKQIATEIGISTDTVRTYWQRIRQKVGGQNRAEIVATLSDKIAAQTLEAVNSEKEVLLREILRRTAVEKALRASEREWRLLADSMPQIVFVSKPDGRVFHYNARFYEYTGLSQEQAHGFGWNSVVHPDDLPNVSAEVERCLPAGTPFEYEMRIRRIDGEYRWHVNRAVPQRDERGKITRWYGTSTDIHESRVLRDRLQDSATFLSQAQRIARLGSYEYDVSRNLGRWSENLFEIFGLKPREGWFDSDEFMSMIHPEDLPSVVQAVRDSIDNGSGFSESYRCVRPDGQVIRVHSVAKPVIEAGAVVRLIGTIQDITEQSEIEQKLRASQQLLSDAEDIARIGSFSWTVDQSMVHWSPNMFRLFERDPARGVMDAAEFQESLHPDDLEMYREQLNRTMEQGQPIDVIYRLIFGSRIKWIHALATTEKKDGIVHRITGTCQDITEQRRVNLEVQKKNEQLRSAEVLANFGSYVFEVDEDRYDWSDNLFGILEVDPSTGPLRPAAFRELLHSDDRDKYELGRRRFYENHVVFDHEFRLRTPLGNWKNLHAKATPVVHDGRLIRAFGAIQDITSRRSVEITRDRLQQIFDSTPDVIRLVNATGEVILCNRAALEFFGAPSVDDLRQRDFQASYPQLAAKQTLEIGIPAALINGSWQGETVMIDAEGREVRASQVILALPDRDKNSYLFTLICRSLK